MSEEIVKFGDTEIEKNKFYHNKNPFLKRCRYCKKC